jgi:16S rRNA (guanine527-N7)-methyltransferase
MINAKNLLLEGLEILCKNDEETQKIIAPRKENVLSLLNCYINEIEIFNPAYGLVGVDSTEELVIKHILDSLAPLGIICKLLAESTNANTEKHIADAGSGAGLPGIPLAIALHNFNFTLIERMGRRAGFLLNTKAVLALPNISIEECELDKVLNSRTERFNLITFRAFKPLEPKLLKTLYKVCTPGGIIAAYKGKREKIEAEMLPLTENWQAIPYTVPFLNEERHILVIRV